MKIIRLLIKEITPPFFLRQFIRFYYLFRTKNSAIIKENVKIIEGWSGNFDSWQNAKDVCIGYESETILNKCKKALLKVKYGEAAYERDSVTFNEIEYSWGLLAGLQKAANEFNGKLSVLDFGGSLGSSYFQNRFFIGPKIDLTWNIVEQRNFVQCGKEHFESEDLKFYSSIEECIKNEKINVVLLSSVLQYIESPYDILKKILKLKIKYIIIDRTALINNENDLLTVQVVPKWIYEASYPCWFFNKHNLIQNFLENSYVQLGSFSSYCDGPVELNKEIIGFWEGFIFRLNEK